MHELLHILVFVWLCFYADFPDVFHAVPRPVLVGISYASTLGVHLLYGVCQLCIRRLFRPSLRVNTKTPRFKVPSFQSFHYETRDGIKLNVRIAKSDSSSKVMLLAAPLGQCGPDIFNPIMCWFGPAFTYVTWDYRGLFGSDKPKRPRKISIPEHANDAMEVLEACGFAQADVMIGHSMGTAVTFECLLLFPEKVRSFIIMNGFHGHVFSTVFQLVWRHPVLGDLVAGCVNWLLKNTHRLDQVRRALQPIVKHILPIYARWFGSKMMKSIHGERYLLDFFESYLGHICESTSNMESYIQLFQELDAHSVYHLLPSIKQPALLISGLLDFVTPAMQTMEIERQIPHASHYCDPFSSHASILESPEWCVAEMAVFLHNHVLTESLPNDEDKKQQ